MLRSPFLVAILASIVGLGSACSFQRSLLGARSELESATPTDINQRCLALEKKIENWRITGLITGALSGSGGIGSIVSGALAARPPAMNETYDRGAAIGAAVAGAVATLGGIVVLVANDAGKTANSKFSALNCADVLYPQTPVSPPTPPEGPTPPVAPPPGPDPGGSIGLNTSEPPAQSGVYFGHRSTPPTTLVPAML